MARMGPEGQNHYLSAVPSRSFRGLFENRPVPEMDTIKYPDGQMQGPGFVSKLLETKYRHVRKARCWEPPGRLG